MAKLFRCVMGTVLFISLLGLSWRLYELHQQLQQLEAEVSLYKHELHQASRSHADWKRMSEIQQYRVVADQWVKTHPQPTPTPKPRKTEWRTFRMSAYVAHCKEGCTGKTATGYRLTSAKKDRVIAVDPKIIPLYSVVEIEGLGVFRALDTGGKIKGHKIDLFVDTVKYARQIGVRHVKVRIVQKGSKKKQG